MARLLMPVLMSMAAHLPLSILHALGSVLGWAMVLLSRRYRSHLYANMASAGYADRRLRARAIGEAGKMLAELPALWLRPHAEVASLVREVTGWNFVDQVRAAGSAIVFVTPHHGCFEVCAQYASFRFPLTIMYRAPKLAWLEPCMRKGRGRAQVRLASAERSGVRELLAALKRREAVGILPDQVPGEGEGEWVEFFGKPAYTMTLASKLAGRERTVCLIAFARRLAGGRGYALSIRPLPPPLAGETPARTLNRALEDLIRECPEQYLWGYNRYKTPGLRKNER